MIYASETLKPKLKPKPWVTVEAAEYLIVDLPEDIHLLTRLKPEQKALGVFTRMVDYSEWKIINQSNIKIVKIADVDSEIENMQAETLMLFESQAVDQLFESEKIKEQSSIELPTVRQQPINEYQQPIQSPLTPVQPEPPITWRQPEATIEPIKRRGKGRIIVSFSAKGGVGKTFMAMNAAGLCALEGRTSVVLDMDIKSPGLEVSAGLIDRENRKKVVDKRARVPKNGWMTLVNWREHAANMKDNILCHNSGLYVIPAYPDYPYPYETNISRAEIEDMLYILSDVFDVITIDLGVDFTSNEARASFKMADDIILVGGQDDATIGKIAHFLKQEGGYNEKMHLVINMSSPLEYHSPDKVAKDLGFKEFYEVPLDKQGVLAAFRQHKFVVQLPDCTSGTAIRQFVAQTMSIGRIDQEPKKKSLFSFSRLIGRG